MKLVDKLTFDVLYSKERTEWVNVPITVLGAGLWLSTLGSCRWTATSDDWKARLGRFRCKTRYKNPWL